MADEENPEAGEKKAGGGKKKIILLVLVGIVLIALSVGGTLLALSMLSPTADVAEDETAEEVVEEVVRAPAIYYPLKPPIIVNFNARGRQRYLQAELTLMTREDDVVATIEMHMPMIRNSLVLLFGGQVYEELQTAEGKELLRQDALAEIQRLLEQEIGKPGVEQVLFTNFVMQ